MVVVVGRDLFFLSQRFPDIAGGLGAAEPPTAAADCAAFCFSMVQSNV